MIKIIFNEVMPFKYMRENFQRYCGIKAIVFDLDGTLIDTMRYFGEVASKVINKYYGIPVEKAREMYFETSGVPFFQQLEIIFPGDSRNSTAAEEYEKRKLKFFFEEKFPPRTKEIIEKLKKRFPDFIFAVSSNNFEDLVKKYMEKYEIKIFDEILGYRENFAKGNDHFQYLENKYGVKRNDILFIGDSWWDAKLALDSGVRFLGITTTFTIDAWKKRYPDVAIIEDFSELFDLLEVLEKCRQ